MRKNEMGKTTRRLITAAVILFIFGFSMLAYSINELIKLRKLRRYYPERPLFQVPEESENLVWWSEPEFIPRWSRAAADLGYLIPPQIWSAAIYEEGNETKVILIGPLGNREWVDQYPKPTTVKYETNYRFYCLFGGEGNLKQGEVILDKHQNTLLITCTIPPEEMFYLNMLEYVMVSLFEVTFNMQTQFIKVEKISERNHSLIACSMIKNEAQYLPEWIEYLKLMGVTKVVLYDNGSSDNVTGALEPYVNDKTVTIIPWKPNIPLDHPKYNPQIVALNDCLWRYRNFSRYQIHIDVDEFPYPVGSEVRDLVELIDSAEKHNPQWHTLKLTMLYFGDAKVNEVHPKKKGSSLVLESQLWRSKDIPHPLHMHHYKPIFKVANVKSVSVHTASSASGDEVTVDHKRVFRLNHYWRRERGKHPDLNKVYDEGTLKFVPYIKRQLKAKNYKI